MLFQEIRNLAGIDLRIRPEVEGNAFVLALDLRHVQTVGRHTDEGDPQQIVHCLGDVAEAVYSSSFISSRSFIVSMPAIRL